MFFVKFFADYPTELSESFFYFQLIHSNFPGRQLCHLIIYNDNFASSFAIRFSLF